MGAYDYPAENEQVKDGLTISYRHEGPRAVVRLGGDLDMYASSRLHRELEDILRSPAEALEIDAAALEFIDSAGLRTVLRARSEAQTRTMEFQVTAVSPAVERVIDLAGLRDILLPPAA